MKSKTGRTQVSVDVGDEGKGLITVVQDGRTIHSFSIPEEQRGPNGDPKNG